MVLKSNPALTRGEQDGAWHCSCPVPLRQQHSTSQVPPLQQAAGALPWSGCQAGKQPPSQVCSRLAGSCCSRALGGQVPATWTLTQPLLFPRPQKASFALPGEKLLKDLPACLCYEVLMHEFCPAVKTREGWVCAPVVIGNLIHDIRETVAAWTCKRTPPGFFLHNFVEEESK